MKGINLKVFVHQFQKHNGTLSYEWLLQKAKSLGYRGGTAFLSLASFGHSRLLHEQHFYELGGGNLSVVVEFLLTEKQAEEFLHHLESEKLDLFYVKIPAEFGSLSEAK